MDPPIATTTYTSSRRTTLVLTAALLFTLALPFLPFIDEDGARRISEDFARHPIAFVLGTGFWLVFAAIMIAASSKLSHAHNLRPPSHAGTGCHTLKPGISSNDPLRFARGDSLLDDQWRREAPREIKKVGPDVFCCLLACS